MTQIVCTTLIASALMLGFGDGKAAGHENSDLDRHAAYFELSNTVAPIRSPEDLSRHLADNSDSPFFYLSADARERFISSITFNERGVTGFEYMDLERELTPTQIFEVMSLIGQQQFTWQLQGARVETKLDELLLAGEVPGIGPLGRCPPPGEPQSGASVISNCDNDNFLKDHRCSAPGNCEYSMRNSCTVNC